MTLQDFLRRGPFLSWSGFEAICDDFNIAAAVTTTSHHHATVTSSMPRSPSSQRPSEILPKTRVENTEWVVAEGFLLNTFQATIAFTSACTHGSVVASFPEGGGGNPAARENGRSLGEKRTSEEEEAYWQVGYLSYSTYREGGWVMSTTKCACIVGIDSSSIPTVAILGV